MANLATVLKSEVARLARKELRATTEGLRKSISGHRSEIISLKGQVQELERQLKALTRTAAKVRVDTEEDASTLRFRAKGMASNRQRLGLSAHDFGLLVGATGQSVYSWERGKSKPRAKALAAIAELRGLGKREVARRLEALKQAA